MTVGKRVSNNVFCVLLSYGYGAPDSLCIKMLFIEYENYYLLCNKILNVPVNSADHSLDRALAKPWLDLLVIHKMVTHVLTEPEPSLCRTYPLFMKLFYLHRISDVQKTSITITTYKYIEIMT